MHNIELAVCADKTVGLVHYPTKTAPASGSVTVITQCADNAHRISSSMSVSCTSSGSWSGTTPQCECDTGYHAVTVDGMHICQTQGKHFSIFKSTLVCLFCLTAVTACPAKSVNLVHYPTTLAPVSGSVTVTAECADNAHISNTTSLNVSCTSSGSWSGKTPHCQCNEGYHSINVNGTQICEGKE